jgi:hypothetical protein
VLIVLIPSAFIFLITEMKITALFLLIKIMATKPQKLKEAQSEIILCASLCLGAFVAKFHQSSFFAAGIITNF